MKSAILAVFLLLPVLTACADRRYMRTEEEKDIVPPGTYTLILYGGKYAENLKTVALLDPEGDAYSFEIFSPEFRYEVKPGMRGGDAFREAERFVGYHRSFRKALLSRILDDVGATIGYELRPLYEEADFGFSDVLDVRYLIGKGRVRVKVRLRPELDKSFFEEDFSPFKR